MANEVFEMNEVDEVHMYHLNSDMLLREENKELTERLSAALETVVAFERVNKEWEEVWKPIDDLVRPITPLGCCVGKEALVIIKDYLEGKS